MAPPGTAREFAEARGLAWGLPWWTAKPAAQIHWERTDDKRQRRLKWQARRIQYNRVHRQRRREQAEARP